MTSRRVRSVVAVVSVVVLGVLGARGFSRASAQAPELGTIQFPTSGAAGAQPAFLEGVKELHSFQFDEAADAFKKAQQADPSFALAYWGEAMSYNHPLWAQVDVNAAKKALETRAPTPDSSLGT